MNPFRPGISGCQDHNCIFQDNSIGVHTNGGCRCEAELIRTPNGRKAVATIHYLRALINKIKEVKNERRNQAP